MAAAIRSPTHGTRTKVVILQKYLAPYRQPMLRAMADDPSIDLALVCFGRPERRRQCATSTADGFAWVQAPVAGIPLGYESNFELPIGLAATLRNMAPDVVVCAPDWGGAAALRYRRRHPARLLIWSESTRVTEARATRLKEAFRRYVYGRSDGFVVPGSLARDYVVSLGATTDVREVRNSIDEAGMRGSIEEIADKFRLPARRVIAFSGSLIERKGIALLLEAYGMARARHPDAARRTTLRMIGDGPLRPACEASSGVECMGHLAGDAYRTALGGAHVFVLPSLADCNPLVVIEALNVGCALIVSDGVGNYPEALDGNGRLVARGDVGELSEAIGWAMTAADAELAQCAVRSRTIAVDFDAATAARNFVDAIVGRGCAAVAAVVGQ